MAALQHKDEASSPHEPSVASIVACAVLFAAFWLLWTLWSGLEAPADDKAFHALRFARMLGFLSFSHYSMGLVDAYGIAVQMDKQATFSGWIIGIYHAWYGLGALLTWMMLQAKPSLCVAFPRAMVVQALLIHIVGAIAYVFPAGRYAPASFDHQLMLVSRSTSGLAAGQLMQFSFVSLASVFPASDRVQTVASFMSAVTVGVGSGPIMAVLCNAVHRVFGRPTVVDDFALVGVAQAAGAAALLVCIVCLYPDLSEFIAEEGEDKQDGGAPAQQHLAEARRSAGTASSQSPASPQSASPGGSTSKVYKQEEAGFQEMRWVVVGCVATSLLRAFGVSSLEAATSLVLETLYHWAQQSIGVAIAATFLAIVPVKMTYTWNRERLSTVAWIRVLLCACLVGVALLPACENPWWVILVDALVFPCLYWSDALGLGIMQQHFLPTGSYFDANHGTLFQGLASAVARSMGPVAARAQIQSVGFTGYCIQQAVLVLVFLSIVELVVKPNMRR